MVRKSGKGNGMDNFVDSLKTFSTLLKISGDKKPERSSVKIFR